MPPSIRERVRRAAGYVLKREKSIGPIELLIQMGFLHYSHVQEWKKENPHFRILEEHIQCGEKKLNQTYSEFLAWAKEKKLEPFAVQYQATGLDGSTKLKILAEGCESEEPFFRTHFRPGNLTDKQKDRITQKKNKAPDLVAFQLVGDAFQCKECSVQVESGEIFVLDKTEPICLECADMGHLEFLPSGNATLTRRARKHSPLSAIVNRFNRRRKRYERQGILVTPESIEAAHAQNESDAEQRAKIRERASIRRANQDVELVKKMQVLITESYPGCPEAEALQIATHTAERGSGRVGRSAAGRDLDPKAIQLAVNAWIRHQHTEYDALLMSGVERQTAREMIRAEQKSVVARWQV